MNAESFLQIRNVVKDFSGYKAVNNVSIDIAKGETFARACRCGHLRQLRQTTSAQRCRGKHLRHIGDAKLVLGRLKQQPLVFDRRRASDARRFAARIGKQPPPAGSRSGNNSGAFSSTFPHGASQLSWSLQ